MEIPDPSTGIVLKEYGRNIQKLVDYVISIPDREERGRYAKTLIELMKQINPNMRDTQDFGKLWDHLYIMSDFKLDVETPFPMPEKSLLGKRPMTVGYNNNLLYYKHYGKNIELLIAKALQLEDKDDQEAAIIYIGKLMKRFYQTWNKENITDDIIIEQLITMSKNKLPINAEKIKANNLFDSHVKEMREPKNSNQSGGSSNGNGYKREFRGRDNSRDNNREYRDNRGDRGDRDRDNRDNKYSKDKRRKN
ncbi:MAG: DUF4290 domain-containing protein [Sporocytophaga sp.]|uniref:DUF4290 domain-containing protein n=1 Tax=Sporocytophaga sp. TaxID=2231183 RepID=UPI001B019A40|nr:DUF4290 domain-containing protein [Sporocytophaga sp.]MBO9701219.1 DUF4290 domain-containing protein [Sporocytophaga sp.]